MASINPINLCSSSLQSSLNPEIEEAIILISKELKVYKFSITNLSKFNNPYFLRSLFLSFEKAIQSSV